MTDPNRIAAIDPARTIHLGDGWGAAVCVNPDGEESLWILASTPGDTVGCACPDCAPHEQPTPYTPRPLGSREAKEGTR